MDALHALDAYTSPLGDVKAAIDAYEAAGKAAQVLFAVEPITQAAIDTYNQEVGPRAAFIRHASTAATHRLSRQYAQPPAGPRPPARRRRRSR